MPTRHRRRSRFAFLLLPLLFCAIAFYFGWQSTRGEFSQLSRENLKAERHTRQVELVTLVAQRRHLEEKVKRLRTDALDADLLDERARAKLNMAHPNELVIMHAPLAEGTQTLAAHNR
ncbi:septum formation initiator family protein [Acuticoccus sp. M5D2P5]|uniref:FtsB family cell division protein n=1 Tax=Acuticoccus kalidii TaxID=2910977 RepID=UPI001F2D02EA|nr:septum formation initiator family protein [Acuticoccus kalidii]MCF3932611.1 septum formation initiator family protein [Acuticoccus kalidii]